MRWTHFSFWSFDIVTVALCYEFVLLTARLYREKRGDVTSNQELWFKTSNWVNRLHLALVSISDTLALTSALIYAPFFHSRNKTGVENSNFQAENEFEKEDEIQLFNFHISNNNLGRVKNKGRECLKAHLKTHQETKETLW